MTRVIQEFLRQSNELLEELHRNPRVTYLDIHLLETQVHIFQFELLKIKQESISAWMSNISSLCRRKTLQVMGVSRRRTRINAAARDKLPANASKRDIDILASVFNNDGSWDTVPNQMT